MHAVQVPLYDTFGAEAVEFIIKHSHVSIIFCSSSKLAALAEVLPEVKQQVVQVQRLPHALSRHPLISYRDSLRYESTQLFSLAG